MSEGGCYCPNAMYLQPANIKLTGLSEVTRTVKEREQKGREEEKGKEEAKERRVRY